MSLICWEINVPPTMKELEKAIKSFSNHKMTGDDGMVTETLKYAESESAKSKLLNLFAIAWNTGQLPTLMCRITLLPIFKKGDPLECSNYRGIANLSQWLKILSKIIYFRIDSYCEQIGVFQETQNGFRTARGRRDLILIVRYVQSLFVEKNLNLYMAFIDIAKTYNSIQRELIWKVLKKIGLPPLLIRMLKMIYESIECRVRVEGIDSDPFTILVGLLQGDSNSTLIFNVIFSMIIEITHQRLDSAGIKLRVRLDKNFLKVMKSRSKGETLTILELVFADDTFLCTDNEDDLQKAVIIFSEVCMWFGLQVSVEKTEVMIQKAKTSTIHTNPVVLIRENQLKNCQHYRYLGSIIAHDSRISKEINARVQKSNAAFSKLYQRVWSRSTLSLKTKASVYRTMILPILTQDCETWHLKHKHYMKLEGCQY